MPSLHLLVRHAAVALPIAVPAALAVYAAWPGHMSQDSLAMIDQAQSGRYTDQLAPLMAALWHPFYTLGVGPGFVLVGQFTVFSAAVFALLRIACPPLIAALAAGATLIFPPVLSMLVYISRDTWFTAFLTAAIAALAHHTRLSPNQQRRRVAALVIAVACLLLAQASRQNAFPAILTIVCAWGHS